jgi:Xaa-Pro aminopeptidase
LTAEARPAADLPDARFAERLARSQALMTVRAAGALLIGVGAELRYLTGYAPPVTERLTMLVLLPVGRPTLVVPRLEAMAASIAPAIRVGAVEVFAWDETDDPHAIVARHVGYDVTPEGSTVLLNDRLWASHVLALGRVLPELEIGLANDLLRELRMTKDEDEIELLRLAAHAADRVIDQIAAGRLVGRTEAEVAREVRERLISEGHDTADFAIVASGPNSASPHHEASERVIQPGEPIVLDIGGVLGGYCSDTTRTLWVTGGDSQKGPDEDFMRVFDLVREAQAEASSAVRPGMPCQRLDEIARNIIEAGGYGRQFLHRLGHGIGLEVHEDPYLVAGNDEPLRDGVAFSVEPGIYLEGRYGVRIEDIVVCGPDGPVVLNESSRELRVVDG